MIWSNVTLCSYMLNVISCKSNELKKLRSLSSVTKTKTIKNIQSLMLLDGMMGVNI